MANLFSRRYIAASFVLSIVSLANGQTTSHINGPITFNGASSFTAVATNTDATPLPIGITATQPLLIYPEEVITPTPTANDTTDGFSITGRFDFQNGTGTTAQLVITGTRGFTINSSLVTTASDLQGQFGVGSTDLPDTFTSFTNPITGLAGVAATGTVTGFSVETYVTPPAGGFMSADTTATATGLPASVPVTPNFPTDAITATGPEASKQAILLSSNYNLIQVVTINFSNLVPGEPVDINLPEPGSIAILTSLAGWLGMRRRNRA